MTAVDSPAAAPWWTRFDRRALANYGVAGAVGVLIVVFSILSDVFLTTDNLSNVGRQSTLVLIAGFAMTFVILAGEIDLSVGAVGTVVGVVTAMQLDDGTSPVLAVALGIAVGTALGLLNGALIVFGRLPSFIVTLGAFYALQGIARSMTDGSTITYTSPGFREVFATGEVLGIPNPVILAAVLLVVLHTLARHTRFGADVYATGGDADAARMAGVRVDRTKLLVFVLAGAIMAIASMGAIARVGNARPDALIGLEFDAIAAVVIGGTSFTGGRGSLLRTVLGALLIGIVNNGLTLLDVDFFAQLIVKGVIIIMAVLLDRWAR